MKAPRSAVCIAVAALVAAFPLPAAALAGEGNVVFDMETVRHRPTAGKDKKPVGDAELVAGKVGTRAEQQDCDRWFEQHWLKAKPGAAPVGLAVLANNDPVIRNNRGGRPLKIAGKQYRRGLYCHAVSKVVVYLPSPAAKLSAVVGVDSNEQTAGGRGSVIFLVRAGGKELFRSKRMREGMAAERVQVDLGGATSFTLEVSDAGDGISCDQSDWADAKVVLADGKELWLGDLPFVVPAGAAGPPISFTYGGKGSAELLAAWPRTEAREKLDGARTRHTITWTDKATGLAVRCVAVRYSDFPTVEWTVHLKNTGAKDTPILADVQALDAWLSHGAGGGYVLHHHVGSIATMDDYRPLTTPLRAGESRRFAPVSGRGSDGVWPYFNVEWPRGGAIVAVGWPGQWAASFTRDSTTGLHVRAGQERTHFRLRPGEAIILYKRLKQAP